jgi:hypothetical protein
MVEIIYATSKSGRHVTNLIVAPDPFRHTGEGRYPWRPWVPAFAGKTSIV